MWGVLGCKIYGFLGAVCGCCSLLTMIVIGYDRYNQTLNVVFTL